MTRRLLLICCLAMLLPAVAQAYTFGGARKPAKSLSAAQTAAKARKALVTGSGVKDGTEITPLLKALALKLPRLDGAAYRRAAALLARPTIGEGAAGELEYETAEAAPVCSDHFCVHYVKSTADAPPSADSNHNGVPDYVETMDDVFEHVYAVENGQLGWQPPKSDGNRGCGKNAPANCSGKTDVYIKEIGSQGIYGYAAPDPGQKGYKRHAYLVMDDDYNATQFPRYEGDPLQPMEVTAAHEYNHVLQFNYDTAQDTWMFESTAVWMEDYVYTDVNDYLQYLTPWAQMTFVPLTYFNGSNSDDPLNVKVYGDVVWNRWIEAHYGPDTIRTAWESSRKSDPKDFAPGAYDVALRAKGTSFYAAFAQFAAETAEWRASNSSFVEGETFPDVDRASDDRTGRPIALTPDQTGASGALAHTSYILLDVHPPEGMPQMRLAVTTPRGTRMAIALVARTGDEVRGATQTFLKLLTNGGPGTVTVDNPSQYERLTAVVINGDARASRYSSILQDWVFEKDSQRINGRVSADFDAPALTRRSPAPGARHASTRTRVVVGFTDRMFELTKKTVRLIAPNGRSVRAALTLTRAGRKVSAASGATQVVLKPVSRLRRGTRYEVRLSRDLRDFGGNALPGSSLSWKFRTKR